MPVSPCGDRSMYLSQCCDQRSRSACQYAGLHLGQASDVRPVPLLLLQRLDGTAPRHTCTYVDCGCVLVRPSGCPAMHSNVCVNGSVHGSVHRPCHLQPIRQRFRRISVTSGVCCRVWFRHTRCTPFDSGSRRCCFQEFENLCRSIFALDVDMESVRQMFTGALFTHHAHRTLLAGMC